jgi:hypothetical protein
MAETSVLQQVLGQTGQGTGEPLRGRKMKAKTKFLKMVSLMPDKAQRMIIMDAFSNPKSMRVCREEVFYSTNCGKRILKDLGYEDD